MLIKHHLFKSRVPLMNKALDAYALRQQTIAQNIANATTVDYKPEKVKFEEYFKEQIFSSKGSSGENNFIGIGKTNIEDIPVKSEKKDIPQSDMLFTGASHVNIDKEMAELAQNQIRFRLVSRSIKNYMVAIQNAITGIIR